MDVRDASVPVKQVEHPLEKGAAGPNHFACVVKSPDKGFKFPSLANFSVAPFG